MAHTYSQLHIHFVFSVKHRDNLINTSLKEKLYKYITGIVQNQNHKMICIGGMSDHIHILIGMNPLQSVSDLIKVIKCNSSKWINENRFAAGKFEWQEGYAAFSYGKSQVNDVVSYINNQEEHHKKRTFKEEYTGFLKKFEIEYNEEYVFDEMG